MLENVILKLTCNLSICKSFSYDYFFGFISCFKVSARCHQYSPSMEAKKSSYVTSAVSSNRPQISSCQLDRRLPPFFSLFLILTADSGSVICMRRLYSVRLCKPTVTSPLSEHDVNYQHYGVKSSF